jgi:predicted DNA-binding transcriptional regulator AlpA
MNPDERDELLTVADVAERTTFAPSTLRTRRHLGLPPESFKLGSRVVYRASVVRDYIAKSEAETRRGQS